MVVHMFVLGIDPGLTSLGYGAVRSSADGPRAVSAGVVRTSAGTPIGSRLAEIHRDLTALIEELHPDAFAIEGVFVNRNLQTATSVGRASGVALLAAAQQGLEAFEYSPSQVKRAVAGYGGAPKDQVQRMVARRLGLASPPAAPDAADALAVALCHLQTHRLRVAAAR